MTTPTETARQFVARINEHDVAALSRLMTPEHRLIDPGGLVVAGREDVQAAWRAYFRMIPDYWIALDDALTQGNTVLLVGRAGGTYAPYGRYSPDRRWQVPAAWRAVVRSGAVGEWQVYADNEPLRAIIQGERGAGSAPPRSGPTPGGPHVRHVEHVALWARDVDALCAFYAGHFGAQIGPRYENAAKAFASRFLSFDAGARVEVMGRTHGALPAGAATSEGGGYAHIALSVGSEEAVNALTEHLRAAGVPVLDGPRRTGDGYYESVMVDPEGNRIELTA